MSIREHIAYLENLSALDAEIRQLDEQLNHDREALAALKQDLARLEERIASDTSSISEMARMRGELTQEARQMAAQAEKSREKLARARNEREQNAASRELEELRRLQKDREEEVSKLTTLEAAAHKSKDEAEGDRARLLEQLTANESSISSRLVQVDQDKNAKIETRKQVASKIPKNLSNRYDAIRKRRGVAIAVTHDGTCLACRMSLPPQLFQRILRDEAIETCPYCQRILYHKPPPEKDET